MKARFAFTAEDLDRFAALSGDYNPIHVDAEQARRLLGGAQVVHGVLIMLWGLDQYAQQGGGLPEKIEVHFRRPVVTGETLYLTIASDGEDTRLSIRRDAEEVASLLLQGSAFVSTIAIASTSLPRNSVAQHEFAALQHVLGKVPLAFDPSVMDRCFTHLISWMGAAPLGALMACSRIVGMECPGLNSLFTGLVVAFDSTAATPELSWRVIRHTSPAAPIKIAVNGGGIRGELTAMMRSAPVQQPSLEEVCAQVRPHAFAAQKAMVVGGSRGLGELTAKIVAAGGGDVIITYLQGRSDAERVAAEIGPRCRILQFNALDGDAHDTFAPYSAWVTHLYYFATARIVKGDSAAISEQFKAVYVTAFERLVHRLARTQRPLDVFYPSSVFVHERPLAFAAYSDAKLAGEDACARLTSCYPNVTILAKRLPRLATDQTSSLLALNIPPALPVMMECVTELQQRSS